MAIGEYIPLGIASPYEPQRRYLSYEEQKIEYLERKLDRIYEENRYLNEELRRRERGRYYPDPRYLSLPEPKKKSNMKKLTVLAKTMLDSDTRAFMKAGVLDEDLSVTDEGIDFLLAHYLSDNKKKLAVEARKKIKEEKEDK